MNHLAVIILLFLSELSMGATLDSFTVTDRIANASISLSKVKVTLQDTSIQYMGNNPANSPLGSRANLLIEGRLEGGWCKYASVVASISPAKGESAYPNENSIITLHGIFASKDGRLKLNSTACADGSMGTFSIPAVIEISDWSKSQTSKTWTFKLTQNSPSPETEQVITVKFDKQNGWSLE